MTSIIYALKLLQKYFLGFLVMAGVEILLYTALFFWCGIPWPFPAGILAGLAVLVPVFGPLVSMSVTALLCIFLGKTGTVWRLLAVSCGIYLFMNLVETLILYPRFLGRELGLSPWETVLAVLLGGFFFGFAGVILAIPVIALGKKGWQKLFNQPPQTGNRPPC